MLQFGCAFCWFSSWHYLTSADSTHKLCQAKTVLKMNELYHFFDYVHKEWINRSRCVSRDFISTWWEYRKVASNRLSQLEAHFYIFRLFMKGNFDAYVLWPLVKKFQNWIVDQSTACKFMVFDIWLMPIWFMAHAKPASTKFSNTYLDFSHSYLAHAHFSQCKKCMSQGPAVLFFCLDLLKLCCFCLLVYFLLHYWVPWHQFSFLKLGEV